MSTKYLPAGSATIITNDLFLASFLHCVGCPLARVEKNERSRVSFVFTGPRVKELREAYRNKKVSLDMTAFRSSMQDMRRRMDRALSPCRAPYHPYERSMSHVRRATSVPPVPHR